jgi:hypothetical protein
MTNPIPEPRNEGPVYGEITVQKDAANRGWRTLGQSVLSGVLTYLGALGADLAVPDFELSYEAVAVGVGIAVLTPVLAWLQRRAGK